MSLTPSEQSLLHLDLPPITVSRFCDTVLEWAGQSHRPAKFITYLNAHNVNLAASDPAYANVLSKADLLYADGMGVVWGWRALGKPLPERVNAGDFILPFCRQLAREKKSIYLLGSFPGVAEQAAQRWTESAPGLSVCGTHHGFFSREEEDALVAKINNTAPAILLVGMGVPLQEHWVDRWRDRLEVPVVWCVGALFEYWGMNRSRAPLWMRRIGLEWLWRLALEPRRLSRRYLAGNIQFVRHVLHLRKSLRKDQ